MDFSRKTGPTAARRPKPISNVLGVPEVDSAIDCVGFEAKAHGTDGKPVEAPAVVLNSMVESPGQPARSAFPVSM
jgi:hypothetical protein